LPCIASGNFRILPKLYEYEFFGVLTKEQTMLSNLLKSDYFHRLNHEMVSFARTGKWRECSATYQKMYEQCCDAENDCKEMKINQFWCLSGFCSVFTEEQAVATLTDFDFILGVAENSPNILEKALSFSCLGQLYFLSRERERAMHSYRRAMKLTISQSKRDTQTKGSRGEDISAGDLFDEIIRNVDRNIRMLRGEVVEEFNRNPKGLKLLGMADGDAQRSSFVPHSRDLAPEVSRRFLAQSMRVPGDKCDTCGVPHSAEVKMSKCQRFVSLSLGKNPYHSPSPLIYIPSLLSYPLFFSLICVILIVLFIVCGQLFAQVLLLSGVPES